ncbi:hypothetical protein FB451DRAFT_1565067 [Mycena latifolia]|nr:hypothetical protein FB451DRAFT_1565067 [Mycena latifolia]
MLALQLDLRFFEVSLASLFPPHVCHARYEYSRAPAARSAVPEISTAYFGVRRARLHARDFQHDISRSAERSRVEIDTRLNASHASHDHIARPQALATLRAAHQILNCVFVSTTVPTSVARPSRLERVPRVVFHAVRIQLQRPHRAPPRIGSAQRRPANFVCTLRRPASGVKVAFPTRYIPSRRAEVTFSSPVASGTRPTRRASRSMRSMTAPVFLHQRRAAPPPKFSIPFSGVPRASVQPEPYALNTRPGLGTARRRPSTPRAVDDRLIVWKPRGQGSDAQVPALDASYVLAHCTEGARRPDSIFGGPAGGIRVGSRAARSTPGVERIKRVPRRRRTIPSPAPRKGGFIFVAGWRDVMLDSRVGRCRRPRFPRRCVGLWGLVLEFREEIRIAQCSFRARWDFQ